MIKKNLLVKKFNRTFISIIEKIESFFHYYKSLYEKNKKNKKTKLIIDQRIWIASGSVIFLFLSYFLIPAFYDMKIVKTQLEKQILEQYNLEVKFEKPLKYSLFPKPHFYIKDTTIFYKAENLAKSDLAKVYITKNNFFFREKMKVKNLKFKKTDFNITKNNFYFFRDILNSNKSEYNLNFKNSKLFYKDLNDDVVFFTEIKNLNFLHNDNFAQELNSTLQIYNTLLKLQIINDLKDKKSLTRIDSHKLRLNIDNTLDYNDENISGLLNLKYINKLKKINYSISKKSLKFNTDSNIFDGIIDLKPFYLTTNIRLGKIDFVKILKDNSILLNLLNSEILNNQNLNANINIFSDSIKGTNYLKDISLKFFFEEGNILIKESTLKWRDSIIITLEDFRLINENNKIFINGVVNFNFTDMNDFYKQYQIKKIYRKKIEKIDLNFKLDLNEKRVELENISIDGSTKKNSDIFLADFNLKRQDIFNKIVFKNTIKDFFANF